MKYETFLIAFAIGLAAPLALVVRAVYLKVLHDQQLTYLRSALEATSGGWIPPPRLRQRYIRYFSLVPLVALYALALAIFGLVITPGIIYSFFPEGTLRLLQANIFILSAQFGSSGTQVKSGTQVATDDYYQLLTLTLLLAAFLGAYIATLFRLFRLVEVGELSPTSLIYSAGRIIATGVVSLAGWHAASPLVLERVHEGVPNSHSLLFVFGFVLGAILVWISPYRIAHAWSQRSGRRSSAELMLINGLEPEIRDRLFLMGIKNVHSLGTANPLRLLGSASDSLTQIVDWVAQAQLAMGVDVRTLEILRAAGIKTIFELARAADNPEEVARIEKILFEGSMRLERPPHAPTGSWFRRRELDPVAADAVILDLELAEGVQDTPHFLQLERVYEAARQPELDTLLLGLVPDTAPNDAAAKPMPSPRGAEIDSLLRYPEIVIEGRIARNETFYFVVALSVEPRESSDDRESSSSEIRRY